MTKKTIECTMDWYKSLKRKGKITLTEYKDGVAQKPKNVEG